MYLYIQTIVIINTLIVLITIYCHYCICYYHYCYCHYCMLLIMIINDYHIIPQTYTDQQAEFATPDPASRTSRTSQTPFTADMVDMGANVLNSQPNSPGSFLVTPPVTEGLQAGNLTKG